MSSGFPSFFIGILSKMVFFCVSLSLSVMLDWIKPGATLLTVIFRLDNSNARDLTMPEIAALEAV